MSEDEQEFYDKCAITALAEYAMAQIPEKPGNTIRPVEEEVTVAKNTTNEKRHQPGQ